MVLAPIGLLFLLLWIANRRAKRQLDGPTVPGAVPADDEPADDEPANDEPANDESR